MASIGGATSLTAEFGSQRFRDGTAFLVEGHDSAAGDRSRGLGEGDTAREASPIEGFGQDRSEDRADRAFGVWGRGFGRRASMPSENVEEEGRVERPNPPAGAPQEPLETRRIELPPARAFGRDPATGLLGNVLPRPHENRKRAVATGRALHDPTERLPRPLPAAEEVASLAVRCDGHGLHGRYLRETQLAPAAIRPLPPASESEGVRSSNDKVGKKSAPIWSVCRQESLQPCTPHYDSSCSRRTDVDSFRPVSLDVRRHVAWGSARPPG